MSKFWNDAMRFLKNGAIILLTIAILIWHKVSLPGWQDWVSTFISGFFISYGIKSMWDQVEDIMNIQSALWWDDR